MNVIFPQESRPRPAMLEHEVGSKIEQVGGRTKLKGRNRGTRLSRLLPHMPRFRFRPKPIEVRRTPIAFPADETPVKLGDDIPPRPTLQGDLEMGFPGEPGGHFGCDITVAYPA